MGDAHALSFKPNGGKRYKIADHLGSTRMVIDENGIIRSQFEYAPFGEQVANYGTSMNAPRKGFIDKEKDSENNLSDFSARKFDDELGRFTSVDALWEKYRAWSPYIYSRNNPLVLLDPSGFGDVRINVTGENGSRLKLALAGLKKTAEGARIIKNVEKHTNAFVIVGKLQKVKYPTKDVDPQGLAKPTFTQVKKQPGTGKVLSARARVVDITIDIDKFDRATEGLDARSH